MKKSRLNSKFFFHSSRWRKYILFVNADIARRCSINRYVLPHNGKPSGTSSRVVAVVSYARSFSLLTLLSNHFNFCFRPFFFLLSLLLFALSCLLNIFLVLCCCYCCCCSVAVAVALLLLHCCCYSVALMLLLCCCCSVAVALLLLLCCTVAVTLLLCCCYSVALLLLLCYSVAADTGESFLTSLLGETILLDKN